MDDKEDTMTEEKIEIRIKTVYNVPSSPMTPNHAYIIYTDKDNNKFYIRGGPDRDPNFGQSFFGEIETQHGIYKKRTVDFPEEGDFPHTTVEEYEGDDLSDIYEHMTREADNINDGTYPYRPLDHNSNTTVGHLLRKAGLDIPHLDEWVPGLDEPLVAGEPCTPVGPGLECLENTGSTDGKDGGGCGDASVDLPPGSPFLSPPVSPLVIDMDGDGIELTRLEGSSTYFDLNADGFAERTGWVLADDALLAYDRNGNGRIDDNSELFGNATGHTDGFAHLAELDTNGDGAINAADDAFDSLLIWQDTDQDGFSDDGELSSLSTAGITSIDLDADEIDETNEGHLASHRSQVTFSDGTTALIEDVHFQNDSSSAMALLPDDFTYHPDALRLPVLWGYGKIASTHMALSTDEALRRQAFDLLSTISLRFHHPDRFQIRLVFDSVCGYAEAQI